MIKVTKYAESAAASSLVVLGYESEGPAAPSFSTKSSAAKPLSILHLPKLVIL
jgi:hypothetical protein